MTCTELQVVPSQWSCVDSTDFFPATVYYNMQVIASQGSSPKPGIWSFYLGLARKTPVGLPLVGLTSVSSFCKGGADSMWLQAPIINHIVSPDHMVWQKPLTLGRPLS